MFTNYDKAIIGFIAPFIVQVIVTVGNTLGFTLTNEPLLIGTITAALTGLAVYITPNKKV